VALASAQRAAAHEARERLPANVLSCIRYSKLEIWCVCQSWVSCDFFAHCRTVLPTVETDSVCPIIASGLIEPCRARMYLRIWDDACRNKRSVHCSDCSDPALKQA